jgi:hypothetical protein
VRAGGPADFVSARWHEFSNKVSAQVSQDPNRIISTSSSNRWRWWTEAWNGFTDKPLQGTGAGTFELVDRVQRNSPLATTEPHSVPLQFLSETGIVGFLLYAAVVAAAVVGILRRERTRVWLALALGVALGFVHSWVDIDWDFIAVQGPLFLTVGALVSGPAPPVPGRRWPVSGAVAVCALAALYSVTSPWLAVNRITAANDAIDRNDPGLALTEARSAHAFNPLSVDALWVEALVEPNDAKALQLYRRARDLEPTNPETWYQLGAFELFIKRPRAAYRDLNHAYTLDNFLFGPKTLAGRQLDEARCKIDPATCR